MVGTDYSENKATLTIRMKLEGANSKLSSNSSAYGNKESIYSGIRPMGQNVKGHVATYTS